MNYAELALKRAENDVKAIYGLLGEVNKKVTKQGKQLRQLDRGIHAVKGQVALTDRRLNRVEERLDGIDSRLDGMDQRFDQMDGKLDRVIRAVSPDDPAQN